MTKKADAGGGPEKRTVDGMSIDVLSRWRRSVSTAVFQSRTRKWRRTRKRTVDGSRCELLPSGPPTPWWSGFAATRFAHRRDGGDLSVRQFFQSRTHMEANQRNARWTATVLPSCRDGGDLSCEGSFPKSDANGGVGGSEAVDGGVKSMPLEKLLSA